MSQPQEPESRYLVSVEDAAFEVNRYGILLNILMGDFRNFSNKVARLHDLHAWIMSVLYKDRYIYNESIVIRPNDRVLDVGTGAGEPVE